MARFVFFFFAFFTLFHLSSTFFRPEVPFKLFLDSIIAYKSRVIYAILRQLKFWCERGNINHKKHYICKVKTDSQKTWNTYRYEDPLSSVVYEAKGAKFLFTGSQNMRA